VFIVDGGQVTVAGSGGLSGSSLSAGTGNSGSQDGSAFGTGVFLHGSGTLAFAVDDGALYTISDGVADVEGSGGDTGSGSWGVTIDGDGTGGLLLSGTNTYTGPTTVIAGGLEVDGSVLSTIDVDAFGILVGIGTAANVLNNGVIAPGNDSTVIIDGMPPGNYRLSAANFSQGSGGRMDIALDGTGDSTRLVVAGAAGLDGELHLQFDALPAPGTTYTVLAAGSINGAFANYRSNMPSVFGMITYASGSVLFTVLANDGIFRDGFEGSDLTVAGACISPTAFAAIPATVLESQLVCIPPFSDTIEGNTIVACQTSTCTATVPGCLATPHGGMGVLSGTLAGGSYRIDTPLSADTLTVPLNISGLAGNVDCTGTLSNASANLAVVYDVSRDLFGDAFAYALDDIPQLSTLNGSVSSSGCGLYGYLIAAGAQYFGPQLLEQVRLEMNVAVAQNFPTGALAIAPGVGDTICPAP
jgi:autotransporter-associated beta strand protein